MKGYEALAEWSRISTLTPDTSGQKTRDLSGTSSKMTIRQGLDWVHSRGFLMNLAARLVLVYLLSEDGEATVSAAVLGKELQLSGRTVSRAIRDLKAMGLIKVTRNTDEHGKWSANTLEIV